MLLTMAPPLLGSVPPNGNGIEAQWLRMHAFAPYAGLADAASPPTLTVPHGTARSWRFAARVAGFAG